MFTLTVDKESRSVTAWMMLFPESVESIVQHIYNWEHIISKLLNVHRYRVMIKYKHAM